MADSSKSKWNHLPAVHGIAQLSGLRSTVRWRNVYTRGSGRHLALLPHLGTSSLRELWMRELQALDRAVEMLPESIFGQQQQVYRISRSTHEGASMHAPNPWHCTILPNGFFKASRVGRRNLSFGTVSRTAVYACAGVMDSSSSLSNSLSSTNLRRMLVSELKPF